MRYILIFVGTLLFSFGLQAQNGNPFELRSNSQDTHLINNIPYQQVQVDSAIAPQPVEIESPNVNVDSEVEVLESDTVTIVTPQTSIIDTIVALDPQASRNPFSLTNGAKNEDTNDQQADPRIETDNLTGSEDSLADASIRDSANLGMDQDSANLVGNESLGVNENESFIPIISNPFAKGKNNFVFWITLVVGLILSILFNGNRGILSDMSKSMKNMNFMKLFQKEQKNGSSMSFLLLYIIFILNFSIFLRFVLLQYEIPVFNYQLTWIIIAATCLIVLRHLSLNVISYLRKKLPDAISYSFIIAIVNSFLGLILVPINLLIAFGPSNLTKNFIIFGIVMVVAAYVLKWFRGFINSARIILGDSFHFLLYLCTCEIAPICICIGFVRNLIN